MMPAQCDTQRVLQSPRSWEKSSAPSGAVPAHIVRATASCLYIISILIIHTMPNTLNTSHTVFIEVVIKSKWLSMSFAAAKAM